MSEIIVTLAVAFALAFLAESLTEYLFGTPFDKLGFQSLKWLLMYIAAAVGVAMALYWRIDVIALVRAVAGGELDPTPFGMVVSGLLIGRGASALHGFINEYAKKPQLP